MIDLEKMEALAKAAPSGQWEVWTSNSWRRVMASGAGVTENVITPTVQRYDNHPDLTFGFGVKEWLEGATPDVVLALIAEVRALREDAARYQWLRDKARMTDYDGGNYGVWDIRGIDAYSNWLGAPYNHKTFEGAVDFARKVKA